MECVLLMIVVAIIGILAAIAIPAYGKYQAKSKLTAGLAEISAAKTAAEEYLTNGGADVTAAPALTALGLQGTTTNCTIAATLEGDADSTISCTGVSLPSQVRGAVMTWTRDADTGAWTCETTNIPAGNEDLAPKVCPQS